MRRLVLLLLLIFPLIASSQQDKIWAESTEYSFVLQDSPALLFTMRQVDESYLSAYRLFARTLNESIDNSFVTDLIQVGLLSLLFVPFTHEEGHRAILTVENIGSISQPYFNKHGAAYVRGVTDQTLMDLRDNNLPAYIRLHAGGLESDFMLTLRAEKIGSFGQDDFANYKWEYWSRKTALLQYFVSGLFKFEIDLDEEEDELKRDIVGYDTYGQARHLHRPDMEFYRYTRYEDLTADEQSYVKRMGYRSLLNLANPLIIGKSGFQLGEETTINGGFGYTMSPFGDFINESIWLRHRELNFGLYLRHFQNRENWFHGFGLGLYNFEPFYRTSFNLETHFWQQPKDFDFNTAESFSGGAIDIQAKYLFPIKPEAYMEAISFDIGLLYKTKGFLPEELYLGRHIGIRFGTTLWI